MLRFPLISILLSCLAFAPPSQSAAQILLDPSLGSGQDLIRRSSGSSPNMGGGIVVGGSNPLFSGQGKPNIGTTDSADYLLPPLLNGAAPNSPGAGGINVNRDFEVGDPTNNAPSYGLPPIYGGGYSPSRYRGQRLTREEIVRRQEEDARMKEAMREEREYQTRIQIEAAKGMREGINSLFRDAGSLPSVLAEAPAKRTTANSNNPPQTKKNVPSDSSRNFSKSSNPPAKSTTSSDPLPKSTSMVAKESLTADERIEQELKEKRAELEKQADSERKQQELQLLQRREEARRRWLEQRAEAERGTVLFEPPVQLKSQLLNEGWCLLFDGKTFFGWRTQKEGPYGGGQFNIVNGEIQSDPQHPGILYTTNQFGDLSLIFEFQTEEKAEAFLLMRTPPSPKNLHTSCYAIVLNSADYKRPRGTILGRHEFDSEQLKEQEKKQQLAKPEDSPQDRWHRVKVQFEAGRLLTTIDQNEPVILFDPKPLGYGYIGILVAKGNVRFRNMIWSPGSSLPMVDPISPEKNWRYRPDTIKLSSTRNLSVQITGGPGVIESKESYNNFVLQLEYNIAYTSARTGVFFRSIPREEQTGYEVSLQNLPKRQDRDESVGVDAGAFRGTKNARYLRPEDQKWNYLTLAVVDRQFQTWINGIPVCEMSDQRLLEKEDSKTGPFLLPGTIQLLAPQAGTNVQFRNIRIMPINSRFEKPKTFEDVAKTTWEELSKARKAREKEEKLDKEMMSEKKK